VLYTWGAKDLAWTQGAIIPCAIFGIVACLISLHLATRYAFGQGLRREGLSFLALAVWIMANLVWSVAENSDWRNHGQYWDLYNRYTINARNVMFAAIAIQGLWYLILRPLRLFDADLPREKAKDVKPPHLSFYFRTQREFEACHSLFWLLKDLAWNYLSIGLWIPTAILTALWALIYMKVACTRWPLRRTRLR